MSTKHALLKFSPEQQAGVLGHALANPETWEFLDAVGIEKSWFDDPRSRNVMERVEEFRTRAKRPPNGAAELLADYHEEPQYVRALKTHLELCDSRRGELDLGYLKTKVAAWATGRVLDIKVREIAQLHNEGKYDEAKDAAGELGSVVSKVDSAIVSSDQWEASNIRVRKTANILAREKGRTLSYGVSVLDDALYGILDTDVILIGAPSGTGKTQLAKQISLSNARKGKRVSVFVLEGEEEEFELRTKFELMGTWFRQDHPEYPKGVMEYPAWRHGLLDDLVAPYVDRAHAYFDEHFSTMSTYYRSRNDFGTKDLHKQIWKKQKDTDLFVIDHFHYIDMDGPDQLRHQSQLMMTIRQIAQGTHVPVVVVAHLRKGEGGKNPPLCPNMSDFHGSAGIFQPVTTAILLSAARDLTSADTRTTGCYPTFIRIVKNRLASDRLYNNAVAWFDPVAGTYLDEYAMGQFNYHATSWKSIENVPSWAHRATIRDVGEL